MSEPDPIEVDNALKSAEGNAHCTTSTKMTTVNLYSPHSKEKKSYKSNVLPSISQPDPTMKRNNNLE